MAFEYLYRLVAFQDTNAVQAHEVSPIVKALSESLLLYSGMLVRFDGPILSLWSQREYRELTERVILVSPRLGANSSPRPVASYVVVSVLASCSIHTTWHRLCVRKPPVSKCPPAQFITVGDPKQKYLAKSLCLAWLYWFWRHAACIPPGKVSTCSSQVKR